MTAKEATERIGTVGTLEVIEGMSVEVRILEAREMFGRTDFLIEPVSGSGQVWKATHNVARGEE